MSKSEASYNSGQRSNSLFVLGVVLSVVMAILFWKCFLPGWIHFSNDGPLGVQNAEYLQLPIGFIGCWADLNYLGISCATIPVNTNYLVSWLLGPVLYSKFVAPLYLTMLGLSVWAFLRRLGMSSTASVIGGLAAALNSAYFSTACWGLPTHDASVITSFLALALLVGKDRALLWPRTVLAGLLVGLGVSESGDVGALFSIFVALGFAFYTWLATDSVKRKVVIGGLQLATVTVFAALMASQAVSTLVSTQIEGIAGVEEDQRNSQERWDWATQWSLPKKEVASLVVPGLFGYRMDTPGGGQYWGAVGQTPGWKESRQGLPRYLGNGYYAGVVVIVLTVWALLYAAQKNNSVYSHIERRWIWYFGGVAGVCLLIAFGRYAPFYQLIYSLPYFSTIRSPVKFLYFVEFALIVLGAFGAEGILRAYGAKSSAVASAKVVQSASTFKRRWTLFSIGAVALSLVGWLFYAGSKVSVTEFIRAAGFSAADAMAIQRFSEAQVGWFFGLLLLALGGIWAVMRWRLKWGGILLGALLIFDLGRANLPWVVFWNYSYKYASNPVFDFLRQNPHEHRVAALPFRSPPQLSLFDDVYRIEWMQHHFQYYNIQSLDIVQMPREPVDIKTFERALQFAGVPEKVYLLARRWQLTNTRYLLGPAGFYDALNGELDPDGKRFRIAMRFDLAPKPGVTPTLPQDITAVVNTNGTFAVFEFTGALPRAKLYSNWEVSTNDTATLDTLTALEFDPAKTVLVASSLSAPASTDELSGSVDYISYSPAHIELRTDASGPRILLLNDRYDPNWVVEVDGEPAQLLRCNYIMRGVRLGPGQHVVRFSFRPPLNTLYISLSSIALGAIISVILLVAQVRKRRAELS